MNSVTGSSAPKWFTIFTILALLWNLFGVFMFVQTVNMTPEAMALLPEAEQALYNNFPSWTMIVYGVAVSTGALGSLFLVLKKNVAGPILQISLVAVLVQMGHYIFISNAYEVYGTAFLVMPILVIVIAAYLVMLAAKAKKNGWTS